MRFQGFAFCYYYLLFQTCRFPGVIDIMKHGLDPDKNELTTEEIFVVDPFLGRIRVSSHSAHNWFCFHFGSF